MKASDLGPMRAGEIQRHRARSTGTIVSIYRNADAGLSQGDPNPWSTVCENHAGIVTHPSLDLAKLHAPAPEEWCCYCNPVEVQSMLSGWAVWRNRTGWFAQPAPDGYTAADLTQPLGRIAAPDSPALTELCRARYGWYDDCDTCGGPARNCGHRQPEGAHG